MIQHIFLWIVSEKNEFGVGHIKGLSDCCFGFTVFS